MIFIISYYNITLINQQCALKKRKHLYARYYVTAKKERAYNLFLNTPSQRVCLKPACLENQFHRTPQHCNANVVLFKTPTS